MTDTGWAALRDELIARYDDFRRRLRRRLGSDDLARETLHETFISLSRRGSPGLIERPDAYLYRVALNIAAARRRSAARRATTLEIETVMDLVDETARTVDAVEARLDLDLLARAVDELPKRQRDILIAARLEDKAVRDIAVEMNVSRRLVEIELKRALEYCASRLERQIVHRFVSSSPTAAHGREVDCVSTGAQGTEDIRASRGHRGLSGGSRA